jgi:drug/metabolite transporter (DMT)-like permease
MLGVLVGFGGVVVLIGGDLIDEIRSGSIAAQFACMGAALSYAFAAVFGRRFARMGVRPMTIATGQLTCSGFMLLPLALWVDQPWRLPPVSTEVIGAMVVIAALSTALAYIIYFRILALAGAVNSLLVTFLMPPVAIILGAAFLDERLAASDFAGLALILAGLACIDGRIWTLFKHQSSENVRR